VLNTAGRLPVADVTVNGQRTEHRRGQQRHRDQSGQPPPDAPVPQGEPRPGRAGPSRMRMGDPDRVGRKRGPRLGLGGDHGRLAAGSGRADGGPRSHARRVPSVDGIRAVTRGASARERHRTLPVGWHSADGPGRASWVARIRHRSFTHYVRTSQRHACASAHARLKRRKPPSCAPSFPPQRSPLLGSTGRPNHTLRLQNG
jgi:hypothetical protein